MNRNSVSLRLTVLAAALCTPVIGLAGSLDDGTYQSKLVIDMTVMGDINPNNGVGTIETWSATLDPNSLTARDSSGRMLNAAFSIDPKTGAVGLSGSAIVDGKWAWDALPQVGGKPAFQIELSEVGGNVDPFMTFSFKATNNGATPLTFTFSQGLSIVPPVAPATQVRATLGYALQDGTGGLALTPVGATTSAFELSSNNGVSFVPAGAAVQLGGPATVGPGLSDSVGFGSTTFYAGPAGTFNYMRVVEQFTLTGGNDVALIVGRVEVQAIPEPGTWAMIVAGLAAVVGVARRRLAHP